MSRLDEVMGKMEVATTDGYLSDLNQHDIGTIYLALLTLQAEMDYLRERVRMGQQKDDADMANEAQARLTRIQAGLEGK